MIDPCEVDQLKLYFKINDEKASELSGIYKNNLVSIDALFYMTITKRSVTEKRLAYRGLRILASHYLKNGFNLPTPLRVHLGRALMSKTPELLGFSKIPKRKIPTIPLERKVAIDFEMAMQKQRKSDPTHVKVASVERDLADKYTKVTKSIEAYRTEHKNYLTALKTFGWTMEEYPTEEQIDLAQTFCAEAMMQDYAQKLSELENPTLSSFSLKKMGKNF